MELAKARVKAARREVAEAEEFAASAEEAWEHLAAIIDESRNIAEAWDQTDLGERRILFSYWVEEVHIVVEPIPEMKHADNNSAVVWLKNVPGPQYFPVGRQLPIAEGISSETQGSGSPGGRATREGIPGGFIRHCLEKLDQRRRVRPRAPDVRLERLDTGRFRRR